MAKLIEKDTICWKVTTALEEIQEGLTRGCDIIKVAKLLHEIRQSATKMEDGLKHRKKAMEAAGIEEDYQKNRKIRLTLPGINKISSDEIRVQKNMEYEFIVKEKGEVVYQNNAYAGVITVVERVEDIDEMGAINGQVQHFTFGHILNQWYAFNQLSHMMEGRNIEVLTAMKAAIQTKQFTDPETKRRLLTALNRITSL